jgi:hypothetical protein
MGGGDGDIFGSSLLPDAPISKIDTAAMSVPNLAAPPTLDATGGGDEELL